MLAAIAVAVIGFCIAGSPYFYLFLLPIVGAFFGKAAVLRFSLALLFQHSITALMPTCLVVAEPMIQMFMLIALVSIPNTLFPYPLLWCYDTLLWASEPILMVMEAIGLVKTIMMFSRKASDQPDDETAKLTKALIICVSGISYYVILCLIWVIVNMQDQFFIQWMVLLTLALLVIIHLHMYFDDEGVLSDAAVISMCSIGALYMAAKEIEAQKLSSKFTHLHSNPESAVESVMEMFVHIGNSAFASTSNFYTFMWAMVTPTFMCSAFMRFFSVVYGLHVFRKISKSYEEEEELEIIYLDEEDESWSYSLSAYRSPLFLRIMMTFVYTQFIVHHIDHDICIQKTPLLLLPFELIFRSISKLAPGRLLQVIIMNGLYLHKLVFKSDKYDYEDESDS